MRSHGGEGAPAAGVRPRPSKRSRREPRARLPWPQAERGRCQAVPELRPVPSPLLSALQLQGPFKKTPFGVSQFSAQLSLPQEALYLPLIDLSAVSMHVVTTVILHLLMSI